MKKNDREKLEAFYREREALRAKGDVRNLTLKERASLISLDRAISYYEKHLQGVRMRSKVPNEFSVMGGAQGEVTLLFRNCATGLSAEIHHWRMNVSPRVTLSPDQVHSLISWLKQSLEKQAK